MLLALIVATGPAGSRAAEPPDQGLAAGPWWAAGSARGSGTASEGPVDLLWTLRVPAQFEFDVSGSGGVRGTWEHQGEGVMHGEGAGVTGEVRGEFAYIGSGSVSGTNRRLVLTGSTKTTGMFNIEGQGHTQQYPVNNTSAIPTLYLNVAAVICDEAYGDWAYTIEVALAEQGFNTSVSGWWKGWRETEGVRNSAEELRRLATETGAGAPGIESESPLIELAANVIRRYNELADGLREATIEQVFSVMSDAENVLNMLRNLSECDEQLIGEDNVEKYINAMTFIIQGLVIGGQDLDPESYEWQLMVQIAARSGAIGAGAIDPAAARLSRRL
ncbi:MAG TPA: hypothetical protein VMP67_06485 [Candidatus Limnocylindria bacterium]|nr:hypothetical protein [Candidatus Limnocylindria bacterium]